MKYAYAGFGMLLFGMIGVIIIAIFQSITVNNDSEYYVLKEAMEAAMLESIDLDCYRSSEMDGCGGVVKISEQKFVGNFTRRFTASITGNVEQYEIQFYDIIESPPKASIVIKGKTQNYEIMAQDGDGSFNIVNALSGILEHNLLYFYESKNDFIDEPLKPLVPNSDYTPIQGNKNPDEIEEDCPVGSGNDDPRCGEGEGETESILDDEIEFNTDD